VLHIALWYGESEGKEKKMRWRKEKGDDGERRERKNWGRERKVGK
jgi:hypothetical protein